MRPIFDYLKDYKNYINKLLANTSGIEGITTGIEQLDTITGGLKEGCACLQLANSTIHGSAGRKTATSMSASSHLANQLNNQQNQNMDLLYRGNNLYSYSYALYLYISHFSMC